MQFFWEFWKFHCFVFTQKSVRALISFQLATPQCGLVLKKMITGHIPVLHENGEIIFSTSADDNVLLRYPSLFICYFSSLKHSCYCGLPFSRQHEFKISTEMSLMLNHAKLNTRATLAKVGKKCKPFRKEITNLMEKIFPGWPKRWQYSPLLMQNYWIQIQYGSSNFKTLFFVWMPFVRPIVENWSNFFVENYLQVKWVHEASL